MKFFFIREEVIQIAMISHEPYTINKEELPNPKEADWSLKLTATPNRIFGENVLVAVQMSDKWSKTSNEVPILKFEDREAHLYQAAFPTFGGSMGVHPLQSGEPYWYEQIKGHFLYPPTGAFANPPSATEGVLRDLGIDPEERPEKAKKKTKKVTVDTGATSKRGGSSRATTSSQDKGTLRFRQSNLEDYVIASDSLEGLSRIGEKKTSAAGSKSSGSAGSGIPEAGATPSSIALDGEEEEEEEHEEPAAQLALKKTPEKTKGVEFRDPKESAPKKTKFIIKFFKTVPKEPRKVVEKVIEKVVEKPTGDKPKKTETASTTAQDKTQGPGVVHITGLDQPLKRKEIETIRQREPEIVKPVEPAQPDVPLQTKQVTTTAGGSAATVPEQTTHRDATTAAGGAGARGSGSVAGAFAAGQAGGGSQGSMPQAPIGPKDTLGDIYYKTYTEEARGDAPHQLVWGLKKKDTFMEFAACRDWYLDSFPPGEVNRQRARTHDGLYRAYIVGEGNTRAANNQIVRE
ncbi:hypothetical protein Hdeb2414_s0004g00136421 [Helianthus debilis subsp. tardiflorus]